MQNKNREATLKIAAGAVVGLYLLNWIVLEPFTAAWKKQGERITDLRQKVQRGQQLVDREKALRDHWADMQKNDLGDDSSLAESDVRKALTEWQRESRIGFTTFVPAWHKREDGYDTYECRATATGDQASLGRLIYNIEADPLPARIKDCELTARDAKGKDLMATLRFSFVRINGMGKNSK